MNPYDLDAVDRAVDAGATKVVTISRVYPTDVADLWDACTTAERIPRWLMPVTGELKLGGHYQLEGNAGGTIEACDPPHSFAATWEYGEEITRIEVAITAEGEGARVTLRHIGVVDDARWVEFGPGATGIGWDMMLNGLAVHVGTGAPVDPAEAMAWMGSADGVRFMTESGDAWCAASVAAGTPAEQAAAAAARTLAFYTGRPAPE